MQEAPSHRPPATRDSDVPTLEEELDGAKNVNRPKDRASVTILSGSDAGLLLRLADGELTCGGSPRATCRLRDDAVAPLHARIFERDGKYWVEDLGSSTGTYVRGRRVTAATRLLDGDHLDLGGRMLRFNLYDTFEESAAIELYEKSIHDPTSGAFSRAHFERRLGEELAAMARGHGAVSLLMMDVDEFKRVNDDFGHVFGDLVLRVVTASVERLLRPRDLLARFGGDELVALCPDTTLRNGLILGERIRCGVERLAVSSAGNDVRLSVSVGVAASNDGSEGMVSLIAAADRALYSAKRRGRNRVAGARSDPDGGLTVMR